MALVTIVPPRPSPSTAVAQASEPEAVNSTSRGDRPRMRATRARAASSRARAARPAPCTLLGFPAAFLAEGRGEERRHLRVEGRAGVVVEVRHRSMAALFPARSSDRGRSPFTPNASRNAEVSSRRSEDAERPAGSGSRAPAMLPCPPAEPPRFSQMSRMSRPAFIRRSRTRSET